MIHLRAVTLRKWKQDGNEGYPFNLPVIRSLETLEFTSPVTFFVGENGSGKSTLLEAIACGVDSVTVGSEPLKSDKTLAEVRTLAQQLQCIWNKRTHKGFFLRAEDFFGYARKMAQVRQELKDDLQSVDQEYHDRSPEAAAYARLPYARELGDMQQRYGDGLENFSHGESFLALFQSRFVPGGLYLLDEPEVPLSPVRQLALISTLKSMIEQDSQFIIATHSPILMAFPAAVILNFDQIPVQPVKYQDLDHVRLTRDFLNNPDAYLNRL